MSLSTLLPALTGDAVVDQLPAADLAEDLPAILASFLRQHLLLPTPREDVIRGLEELIADEQLEDIASASEHLGLTPAALQRLSLRFFGSPPKLLLVRTRFTRSLLRMMLANGADYSNIAPTCCAKSHLLRDARRFLDATPRRFRQRDAFYVLAIMHARRDVARAAARMAEQR